MTADAWYFTSLLWNIPTSDTSDMLIEINKSSLIFLFSSHKKKNVPPVRKSSESLRGVGKWFTIDSSLFGNGAFRKDNRLRILLLKLKSLKVRMSEFRQIAI
ncbi:hypothetical protein GQR58_005476 [Nymphon striatum]|nr:hypothetical protein GQR58_005476 [Nymphon striatum]